MTVRPCPTCQRPAPAGDYAPFCSRRCADVDLQRWFSGAYAVPAEAEEDGEAGAEREAGRPGRDLL